MTTIVAGKYTLSECSRINIIFGKNGCGKSTALKEIIASVRKDKKGLITYITPERGGVLIYESSIEQNMANPEWKSSTRHVNQLSNFRQQSVVAFKDLRSSISDKLEQLIIKKKNNGEADVPIVECDKYLFNDYICKINLLLDNIELRLDKHGFKLYSKEGVVIQPSQISSGESELVTLAIECLSHDFECDPVQDNILFLDEPDVHLHPDAQAKLMSFLKDLVDSKKFIVVVATHSSAILGALEDYDYVHFEFMKKNQINFNFNFKKILNEYKNISPIFGAHPLSNIYCSMPIFLVEGADDVWVWQQAIRTAGGKLKIFPCSTDGVVNVSKYEKIVSEIIGSIYDLGSVMGYSLRDRDDTPEGNNLDDFGKHDKIERFMLDCCCVELLFFTDEILKEHETTWAGVINNLRTGQKSYSHPIQCTNV